MGKVKRCEKSVVVFLSVAALLAFPCQGFADMQAWYLNQSNTFADGINYGTVAIDANSSTGVVQFTVDAFNIQPLYGPLTNFGIDTFGFNYQNLTSAPGDWLDLTLPTSWDQKPPPPPGGLSNKLDGFGVFMVNENGTGSTRQDPLVFSFRLPTASEAVTSNFAVLSTGQADQGNVLFAAHVAGFESEVLDENERPYGSHWIGGGDPVPAPGAALLGTLGLGLVGWCRRRLA